MRVFIADDHAVVRQGLKTILAKAFPDATFGEAGDTAGTLRQLRNDHWDVAVLDITMPGRGGIDVLGQIRQLKPRLPVLVLSMHSEDQYGIRVLRAGAAGYLTKESAPKELVGAVRKVLSGEKYVSELLAQRLAFRLEPGRERPPHEVLSDREYQVMHMIASGKTATQIAKELSLSVKTISTYRARVLEKMKMKTNSELTRYSFEMGLVE